MEMLEYPTRYQLHLAALLDVFVDILAVLFFVLAIVAFVLAADRCCELYRHGIMVWVWRREVVCHDLTSVREALAARVFISRNRGYV